MGSSTSILDEERMHEIVKECCELFHQKFSMSFEFALYDEYKRRNRTEPRDLELPQPPLQKFPLKDGWLYKRGDNVKNWKKRHFTLLNEADNFEIQYHKLKGESRILMGTISCTSTSYHVEVFSVEDIQLFGPFGLKLVPYNENHRCWYFIAQDEENKKEWEEVFSLACRKARPQSRHHVIISEAFKKCFESVRHSYGYFSHFEMYGTEEEMLSDFIMQVLHRELLEDTINSIPSGSTKTEIIRKVKQTSSQIVSLMSSKTWKKSVDIITPRVKILTPITQDIVFDSEASGKYHSILQAEDKVRTRLTAAMSNIVDPVLIDVATTFCAPLLASVIGPISEAFSKSIVGFEEDMKIFLNDHENELHDEKKILSGLDIAHRRVSHLSGSFMICRDILWEMYTTNCSNILGSSTSGLDAYDVYCEVSDSIRKLVHNSIHHFGVLLLLQHINPMPKAILSKVCSMMQSDAKVNQRTVLGQLLFRSIEPMVQEMIVVPSIEVMQQFEDIEVNVEGIKREDIVQMCGKRVIEDMINNFLKSLVDEFLPS